MGKRGTPITVEPLTHTPKGGKKYCRPPDVELQIASTLPLRPAELIARAAISDTGSPSYLKEECVVYFIRQSHLVGDSDTTNALSKILLDRTAKWITGSFLKLGLGLEDAINAYRDLVAETIDTITDPASDLGDFFQAKFWATLKGDLINMYDKQARAHRRDQLHVSLTDPVHSGGAGEGGELDAGHVLLAERIESGKDIEIETLYKLEVQQGLPAVRNPLHRKAFILYFIECTFRGPLPDRSAGGMERPRRRSVLLSRRRSLQMPTMECFLQKAGGVQDPTESRTEKPCS